jgi:hypothetical protein
VRLFPAGSGDVSLATDASSTSPGLRAETAAWLEEFAACVRNRHYEQARNLFSDAVIGYGTNVRSVVGLTELEQRQWRVIWEASTDFRFNLEHLVLFGDERLVVAVLAWSSVGYDTEQAPFQRPGRATIVLSRQGGVMLAVHTHFSLDPGVPEATFARRKGAG